MNMLKYCTQYASQFGIVSSGHNTGKGRFSFQFQRRAMPKNVQTIIQLLSFCSLCVDHNKLWKILKEMGIPDHLTCLLRILYAGQEATVRTGHGTTDWFQIGKGVRQGCILSSCLFNLYAEYIMRNAGLEEAQA